MRGQRREGLFQPHSRYPTFACYVGKVLMWRWSRGDHPCAVEQGRNRTPHNDQDDRSYSSLRWSHRFQVLVHKLDRHKRSSPRRGRQLIEAGPHVTGGEHTEAAGLQKERLPDRGPVGGLRERRSRPDEPLGVSLDLRGVSSRTARIAPMKLNSTGVFVVLVSPVLLSASSTEVREQPLPFSRHRTSVLRRPARCWACPRSGRPGSSTYSCREIVTTDHQDTAHGPVPPGRRRPRRSCHRRRPPPLSPGTSALDGRRGIIDAAALEPLVALDGQSAMITPRWRLAPHLATIVSWPSNCMDGVCPDRTSVPWPAGGDGGCAANLFACEAARSARLAAGDRSRKPR